MIVIFLLRVRSLFTKFKIPQIGFVCREFLCFLPNAFPFFFLFFLFFFFIYLFTLEISTCLFLRLWVCVLGFCLVGFFMFTFGVHIECEIPFTVARNGNRIFLSTVRRFNGRNDHLDFIVFMYLTHKRPEDVIKNFPRKNKIIRRDDMGAHTFFYEKFSIKWIRKVLTRTHIIILSIRWHILMSTRF